MIILAVMNRKKKGIEERERSKEENWRDFKCIETFFPAKTKREGQI